MSKKSISAAFDDDQPISEEDIASGKLILRKRIDGRAVQPKKRVTLYLDATVVEHFKDLAGERGYQTLINDALKESLLHTDIEATLRRVIREELRRKQPLRP